MPTSDPTVAPERTLTAGLLGRLAVPITDVGVLLGRDSANRPVRLGLFRPEPVTVAFVGGWWVAQVLVFRCLGDGAQVIVEAIDATDPSESGTLATTAHWLALDRATGGPAGRVRRRSQTRGGPAASQRQPLLRLRDVGAVPPERWPATRVWQTQLSMLPSLTTAGLAVIANADLLLVQRLSEPEVDLLGSVLPLEAESRARLGSLENDMVAAIRQGSARTIWLTPTAAERQLFG